jgi:hypothetical protein
MIASSIEASSTIPLVPSTPSAGPAYVVYPAPFVIALLFSDMLADPSKATPAIVFVAANFVAVPAFPVTVV